MPLTLFEPAADEPELTQADKDRCRQIRMELTQAQFDLLIALDEAGSTGSLLDLTEGETDWLLAMGFISPLTVN